MRPINILHLSDLHVSKAQELYLKGVAESLITDLTRLKTRGLMPDLVCLTGDLINAGDHGPDEFNLAEHMFLKPMRDVLGLHDDRFIFIPGNHEIERSQVSEAVEVGLSGILRNDAAFTSLYERAVAGDATYDALARKLKSFNEFKGNRSKGFRTHESFFFDTYVFEIRGLKVGVAGINSAWRCSQFGPDAGRLVIGERAMREASSRLSKTDFRLLLCHHPFQFLAEWDQKEVGQRAIKDFHLLLNGHVHDTNALFGHYIPGQLFSSTAGSLRPNDPFSGYTMIEVDTDSGGITCHFRKWYKEREALDADLSKCEGGCKQFNGLVSSSSVSSLLATISSSRNQILALGEEADFVSPIEGVDQLHLREVFIEPVITDVSRFETLEGDAAPLPLSELLSSESNLMFVGRPEYGKTTLLFYIQDMVLRDERRFGDRLPLYIRFENIPKTNLTHLTRSIARKVPLLKETQVSEMMEHGKIIFLIDDLNDRQDPDRDRKCRVLRELATRYNRCRYIFTTTELLNPPMRLEIMSLGTDFQAKLCLIASLNTSRIRELLTRWRQHETFDLEQMLTQILYYFQHCQIPVTPLAVTLFFGVLFRKKRERNIRNEAFLIENYLETILEKVKPGKKDGQMDFRDKEDFLSHIALVMCQ